jgi:hypothetical protein
MPDISYFALSLVGFFSGVGGSVANKVIDHVWDRWKLTHHLDTGISKAEVHALEAVKKLDDRLRKGEL